MGRRVCHAEGAVGLKALKLEVSGRFQTRLTVTSVHRCSTCCVRPRSKGFTSMISFSPLCFLSAHLQMKKLRHRHQRTCPRILSWNVVELGIQGLCAQNCLLPAFSSFGDVEGIVNRAALPFCFQEKKIFLVSILVLVVLVLCCWLISN